MRFSGFPTHPASARTLGNDKDIIVSYSNMVYICHPKSTLLGEIGSLTYVEYFAPVCDGYFAFWVDDPFRMALPVFDKHHGGSSNGFTSLRRVPWHPSLMSTSRF
ncbi:MAG: hypothetical protein KAR42_13555 [candidate division Zixibacteria bacterium]|nr:hypothetical protein [candidate division Zixibacteria bacterium]